MYLSPTYRLKLYRDFKAIDVKDPYGIIRYYEQYEEGLRTLELKEYLDCTLTYTDALFETNDYGRHIVMCDHLIELVITENIHEWGGDDIFCRLLLNKGASLFHQNDLQGSVRVLSALIKINPDYPMARPLLLHCLQVEKTPARLRTRAVSLLLLLCSAISAGSIGLWIQPFYPEWMDAATWATGILFSSGMVLYVSGEYLHLLQCRKQLKKWSNYTA